MCPITEGVHTLTPSQKVYYDVHLLVIEVDNYSYVMDISENLAMQEALNWSKGYISRQCRWHVVKLNVAIKSIHPN